MTGDDQKGNQQGAQVGQTSFDNPYRPPETETAMPRHRDLRKAAFLTRLLLYFCTGISAIGALLTYQVYLIVLEFQTNPGALDPSSDTHHDWRYALFAEGWSLFLQLLLICLTAAAYCFWTYRVHRQLAAKSLPVGSATMGVLAFFLPIANLWLPCQISSKLWRTTQTTAGEVTKPAYAYLATSWWPAFVVGSLLVLSSLLLGWIEPASFGTKRGIIGFFQWVELSALCRAAGQVVLTFAAPLAAYYVGRISVGESRLTYP